MRSYEFESRLNAKLKLGETPTAMCFVLRQGRYEPAVLCIRTELRGQEFLVTEVPGLIRWDSEAKAPVREEISWAVQQELGLPLKLGEALDEDEAPAEEPDPKAYYLTVEKLCCALDADCVTPTMKADYRRLLGFDRVPAAEELFRAFFPEAMEQLRG